MESPYDEKKVTTVFNLSNVTPDNEKTIKSD